MKAHVLTGLPNEYNVLGTQLYTNRSATCNGYKRSIHGFWWTELRGKRLMETESVHKDENGSRGEVALNKQGYFHGKCRKCGKWGHKVNVNKSGQKSGGKKKFEGMCN